MIEIVKHTVTRMVVHSTLDTLVKLAIPEKRTTKKLQLCIIKWVVAPDSAVLANDGVG